MKQVSSYGNSERKMKAKEVWERLEFEITTGHAEELDEVNSFCYLAVISPQVVVCEVPCRKQ